MMNDKEKTERILVWQLSHNKNGLTTSMAMSVALLLSACGGSSDNGSSDYSGSSDGGLGGASGDGELDLLNYLDPNQPVSEGEGYVTFNFQYPISVSGNPQLGFQFLLNGHWVTLSSDIRPDIANSTQLRAYEPQQVTYKKQYFNSVDDLPGVNEMSEGELDQLLSTGKLDLFFAETDSLTIMSEPQVVFNANSVLNDDAIIALLFANTNTNTNTNTNADTDSYANADTVIDHADTVFDIRNYISGIETSEVDSSVVITFHDPVFVSGGEVSYVIEYGDDLSYVFPLTYSFDESGGVTSLSYNPSEVTVYFNNDDYLYSNVPIEAYDKLDVYNPVRRFEFEEDHYILFSDFQILTSEVAINDWFGT